MRAVTALSDVASVHVLLTPGINLVSAVGLVVVLALLALQAAVDLSTNTDALANLGEGNLGTNTDDLADDLVADSEGVRAVTPIAVDLVHVAGADTAAFNLDIDILLVERARSEGVLLEVGPVLEAGGLVALELFGVVDHCGCV